MASIARRESAAATRRAICGARGRERRSTENKRPSLASVRCGATDAARASSAEQQCAMHVAAARVALRRLRHDAAGLLIVENLLMRCMLRACMEAAHEARRTVSSSREMEPAALHRAPAIRGQARNATGGRSRSSSAGLCGSVKSPGAGREVSSRIAGCGSWGASVSGTALAHGHGACGARWAGTDSRMGARSLRLDAVEARVGCASSGASARAKATDVAAGSVKAAGSVNA